MDSSSTKTILAQNDPVPAAPANAVTTDPIKDIVPMVLQKAVKTHAAERIPEGFFWTAHYSAAFFIILAIVFIVVGRPTRAPDML